MIRISPGTPSQNFEQFMRECCQIDMTQFTSTADLLRMNRMWAVKRGRYPLSAKAFARHLRAAGFSPQKRGVMGWRGFRLIERFIMKNERKNRCERSK